MGRFRKGLSIVLLAVTFLLLCTSCSSSGGGFLAKTPDMDMQYKTGMEIHAGELKLSGMLKRYGTEFWEMTIDSPETLAGLKVTMNTEGVRAVLDEIVLDIPMEDVRSTAIFSLIFKALDNAASNKLSCTETENGMVYEGELSGMVYRLTFDSENFLPKLLEIPEAELLMEFDGFDTYTNEENMGNSNQIDENTD